MPFTFSHPAIILPLTFLPNKWFSLTGLVIGSLAPDFEYFIRMRIKSEFSHSFFGVFGFSLPIGIILCFVFHVIIRDTLFDNLPHFLKVRLISFKKFNWWNYFKENWIIVSISIIIGAFSHLLWDSFTHEHGYFVKNNTLLLKSIILLKTEVTFYKILQHSSTIIGGVILLIALYKLPKTKVIDKREKTFYWFYFSVITFIIIFTRLFSKAENTDYGTIIVTILSAGMISSILTPGVLIINTRAKSVQ